MRISDWSSDVCSSDLLSGPGAESPIAIYVDGVYQPNQASNLFELPDINRVEVLKGPQGTLFGRNATGGAISIYTRDPTFKPSADITLTAGLYTGGSARSSNNLKTRASVSVPIIDDMSGRASRRAKVCRYGWISVARVSLKKNTTNQHKKQ